MSEVNQLDGSVVSFEDVYISDSIDTNAGEDGASNFTTGFLLFLSFLQLAHVRFNPKLLFWSSSFFILNSFAHFLVFFSSRILSLTIPNDFVFFTMMATQKPGKKIT